jgi:antitoxin component of MazEF toxin-antitoxin module
VREKNYKLDDLLKRITEENIHEGIDFGGPLGKEVW